MDDQSLYFLSYNSLQILIDHLHAQGYACIGPIVKNNVIQYDTLRKIDDLPWGYHDKQEAGHYTLTKSDKRKAFMWANGPQAIKPHLFKAKETVWKVSRDENGKLAFKPHQPADAPIAMFGVKACDIAAMRVQDHVFLDKKNTDVQYQNRRSRMLVIGVNCQYASGNCFCVSAGTGPEIRNNYDIVLTEVDDGFVLGVGTNKGEELIGILELDLATRDQIDQAQKGVLNAKTMQTKSIPYDNSSRLYHALFNNIDHDQWKKIADVCLACGNCTDVCPTCFCHHEYAEPSLDGRHSVQYREWDSCFTKGHSQMTGHLLRDTIEKRYKQWLTHKFGTWHLQFNESGCVGCGRCVTWCPVGIDVTTELKLITNTESIKNDEDRAHDE